MASDFGYPAGRAGKAAGKARPLNERIRAARMPVRGAEPRGAELAREIAAASPGERILIERNGLPARLVSNLAEEMNVPRVRLFQMMDLPRASMEKKIADQDTLSGVANSRTLNLLSLLAQATDLVTDSTSPDAKGFDVARWLGRWIETPQPALGGKKPAELLDTEIGFRLVERTLGALRSGVYL